MPVCWLLSLLGVVTAVTSGDQLLPIPKSVKLGQPVRHDGRSQIRCSEPLFAPQIDLQRQESNYLPWDGTVIRVLRDASYAPEQYRIQFGKDVVIRASTPTGVAWAFQTLGAVGKRSSGEIQDQPDVDFRCVMIDVARRYYSLSTLRTMASWCAAAKVRYMQLHLTDDQNWMFPSKVVPGADAKNDSGHHAYTAEELTSLQSYAAARGVTIIPEIDIPGHSSLLTALDPGLFKLKGSPSTNCINFGSPEVRAKIAGILHEVAELFPASPYIHIGCDEAWYSEAEKDPEVAAAMKRLGGVTPAEVFVDFVAHTASTVLALGKTPLIWEGFPSTEFAKNHIPKKAVIVAWDGNSYPASKLIPDGFRVINAGMDPYYIIDHYPYPLYTISPLERLYNSDAIHFASMNGAAPFTFQDPTKVLGSMLCWWEGHEWDAHDVLPQRILAFGARLWSGKREADYASFLRRSAEEIASLNTGLFRFALEFKGGPLDSMNDFSDSVRVTAIPGRIGQLVGSRTDGGVPGAKDGIGKTLDVDRSQVLTFQAYNGGPLGETMFLPVHHVDRIANLALGCKATATGESDPRFPPSAVTNGDGDDPTNFWLAYPNPQFLAIDLRKSETVARIEVVCAWVTGEPTHYKLSVSEDGKSWTEVVDASKQTGPSTQAGYIHRFDKVNARFVRLEALGGPLYPSTMTRINQIRVFGD